MYVQNFQKLIVVNFHKNKTSYHNSLLDSEHNDGSNGFSHDFNNLVHFILVNSKMIIFKIDLQNLRITYLLQISYLIYFNFYKHFGYLYNF